MNVADITVYQFIFFVNVFTMDIIQCQLANSQTRLENTHTYIAISRKVVGKSVHATISKGNMGYDQYTVLDTVAVEPTVVAFF